LDFNEVKYLFQKEFRMELRRKSGINSILLFVAATTFISFLALENIDHAPTWNALFWIITLFAFINAANNTFRNDSENAQLYLNQLAHPQSILLAKTLYNALLMVTTGILNYLCYSFFVGNLIENHALFILLVIIGGIGFACVLSLTNAISSKASFNNTLMPVLSIPVLIPFFIILVAQTNHLIGNKEYKDFKYAAAREGMEVEVLCDQIILIPLKKNLNNLNCSEFTAADHKGKENRMVFCGDFVNKTNEAMIIKGKFEKNIFYASSAWSKPSTTTETSVKYYGALTMLTLIVLVVGLFLYPKIAKF
jgi:heme exporter protein B